MKRYATTLLLLTFLYSVQSSADIVCQSDGNGNTTCYDPDTADRVVCQDQGNGRTVCTPR